MKNFEKQMDAWVEECKARAYRQLTDPKDGVLVHQQTAVEDLVAYNPEPVESVEVEGSLHRMEVPIF